jgi:hypothetical protein
MTVKLQRKVLILLSVLLVSVMNIYGQADSTRTVKTDSSVSASATAGKHTLFATAGFGSNMLFLGSSMSSGNPFYSGGLVYGYRSSLYLSAGATHISGTTPFLAYYSAGLDYKHTFNSWLDISANMSGYTMSRSASSTLFNDFGYASFTAGFDWRILYTKVTGAVLYSGQAKGYLQISNSRYFQSPYFMKGKAFVSFYPEINLLMGEIVTADTTTVSGSRTYVPPFMRIRRDRLPPQVTYSSRFGPVFFEFSAPVSFSYGRMSLEATPCYLLPAFRSNVMKAPEGFTFFMTATFRIF